MTASNNLLSTQAGKYEGAMVGTSRQNVVAAVEVVTFVGFFSFIIIQCLFMMRRKGPISK